MIATAAPAAAQDMPVGSFKTVQGSVSIVRGGIEHRATPALAVRVADEIVTGRDGIAGLGFDDQTTLALGPSSRLVINQYVAPSGGAAPRFESSLSRGMLAVTAGKIARSSADAMTVRTPNAVLGVRGTRFIVEVAAEP